MRQTDKKSVPKGSPLLTSDRERLSALVSAVGERAAIDAIGCNRQTLARALGGLPIYPGTAALIRERLSAAEAQGPSADEKSGA